MRLDKLSVMIVLILGSVAIDCCWADMIVLESTSPKYPNGARLPDDAVKVLAPGESVRVLLLPSNTTKLFEAPPDQRREGVVRGEKGEGRAK